MANILIVDDSRTSRKILRGLLEANGYVVRTVQTRSCHDGYYNASDVWCRQPEENQG